MSDVTYNSLHSLVEDIVNKHGDSTAVIYDTITEKISISYKQLWEISSQIKTVLSGIINKHEIIHLCLKIDHRIPAILIGVLRANVVFSNFNITSFQYTYKVMRQLGSKVILIHQDFYKELMSHLTSGDVEVITMETDYLPDYYCIKIKTIDTKPEYHRDNIAYCITTSGTTGKPKIVMVSHDCIIPNILHLRSIFRLTSDDLVLAATTLTFDPCIVEIFMTLSSGSRLLILPQAIKMVPDLLLRCIYERNNVTVVQITPTLLSRGNANKLRETILGDNSSLRVIALGGETFPPCCYISSIKSSDNKTICYNLYGITEVSCWSTYYKITQDDFRHDRVIPLGDVLSETNVEIRDNTGQLSDTGFLYVGGCKRKCYIDDEIFDGCKDDIMMRNTGDLVRRDSQGHIYYLGRNDSQIKRNGQRINLEEIKMVCLQHTSIHVCYVEVIDDQIIIFIYNNNKDVTMVTRDDVIQYIRYNLPSYYRPDDVIILQHLPITQHGKIDKVVLKEIYRSRQTSNNTDIDLLDYFKTKWMAMIGQSSLSSSSMFTSDGGTSIQAVYLVNDIQQCYDITLPDLVDLILHGTLSQCETYITDKIHDVDTSHSNNRQSHCDGSDHHQHHDSDIGDGNDITDDGNNHRDDIADNSNNENNIDNGGGDSNDDDNDGIDDSVDNRGDDNDNNSLINTEKVAKASDTQDKTQLLKLAVTEDDNVSDKTNPVNDVSYSGKRKRSIDDTDIDRLHQPVIMEIFVSDYSISRCNIVNTRHGLHTVCDRSSGDIVQDKDTIHDGSGIKLYIDQLWRYNTHKCVDASPLVAYNIQSECYIFIGSHSHRFSAINYYTGESKWEIMLPDRIESSACISYCGKYVLVGCYDGYLYIININDGLIYWRYNTNGTIKCSPIVDTCTGHVYIGSHSHHIYCLNIYEQKCIWEKDLQSGSIFSSPVICQLCKHLYVATLGGKLFALDLNTSDIVWIYMFNKPIFTTPCITDTNIYIGSTDGCLYSFNKSGHMIWKVTTDNSIFSSPSVLIYKPYYSDSTLSSKLEQSTCSVYTENIVIGSHDGYIYCISNTGDIKWKIKTDSPVYSSPYQTMVNLHCKNCTVSMATSMKYNKQNVSRCQTSENSETKLLECIDSRIHDSGCHDNTTCCIPTYLVVVCSSAGSIYIIDINYGILLYRYTIDSEIFSSPVIYDNCIIIGARDDYVYCFQLYLQSCSKKQ